MAFVDNIQIEHLARFFYVTIDGLPFIFSHVANPWPAALPAGYTWSSTMHLPPGWGSISSEAQLLDGRSHVGALDFFFWLRGNQANSDVDLWDDLLTWSNYRSDKATTILVGDLDPDDVLEILVEDESAFPAAGDVYVGTETIGYAAKSAGKLETLTRGKYGSQPIHHVGAPDTIMEIGSGGGFVAQHPMAWKGRVLTLWIGTARDIGGGGIAPFGAAPFSSEDRPIKFVVRGPRRSDDGLQVKLGCASLDQRLDGQIGRRLPRARAGLPPSYASWIHVNPQNWFVAYTRQKLGGTAPDVKNVGWSNNTDDRVQIVTDPGGTLITEDLYTNAQLGQYLTETFRRFDSSVPDVSVTLQIVGVDGELRYQVVVAYDEPVETYFLELVVTGGPERNIWRELGFTDNTRADPPTTVPGNEPYIYRFTAQRPWPTFRWMRGNVPPRKIPFWDVRGPAFNANPDFADSQGEDIVKAVRIGDEEIVGFTAIDTTSNPTISFLGGTITRALDGRHLEEEIYVPYEPGDQEYVEIVQGISFLGGAGISSLKMLLYLMLGGSGITGHNHATYDRGERDGGLFIRAADVDVAAFEALSDQLRPNRDNYFFGKTAPLADIMRSELVMDSLFIVPRYSTSAGDYLISVARVAPPLETELDTARILDSSMLWQASGSGMPYNDGHDLVVNTVQASAGFNNLSEKFEFTDLTFGQATSRDAWGEQKPLKIELRGFRSFEEALARAAEKANNVFATHGMPFVVVNFPVVKALVWDYQIAEAIKVTASLMPKATEIGRGVEELLGRIYAKTDFLQPTSGGGTRDSAVFGVLTVAFRRASGHRYSKWAPSARLSTKTLATAWIADAHAYSAASETEDFNLFKVGWKVRVSEPGDESTAETATISAINPITGAIGFDPPGIVTPGAGSIMEFVSHNDAGIDAEQLRYVFMDDGDHALDLPVGSRNPFTYS